MAAQNFKICVLANQQVFNNLELEKQGSLPPLSRIAVKVTIHAFNRQSSNHFCVGHKNSFH
jgi:hypothetical protein